MEHGIRTAHPQPSPRAAVEPLGDLISGDALHINPAAISVRTWMTVDVAERVAIAADARAAHTAAVAA
ncbi:MULTISPECIES: hypothetical protein [Streptomyces]|uniref:hypothetical protein n=1 Tax=Streptomyces TaxID=1883 RepID=UPI001679DD8D|nr:MULTISPECIES: hypothetical protein [Streptomyces]MBK3524839.1 hypothetical protein [Streptomyces sp. MBT70]GGR71004.1 hypothetical protein GCM10010236_26600 [Streptomyces eurythermus]